MQKKDCGFCLPLFTLKVDYGHNEQEEWLKREKTFTIHLGTWMLFKRRNWTSSVNLTVTLRCVHTAWNPLEILKYLAQTHDGSTTFCGLFGWWFHLIASGAAADDVSHLTSPPAKSSDPWYWGWQTDRPYLSNRVLEVWERETSLSFSVDLKHVLCWWDDHSYSLPASYPAC